MLVRIKNLEAGRGTTKTLELFFFEDEAQTVPQVITGWQFFFTVKKNYSDIDSKALIVKNPGDIQIGGDNNNRALISISADDNNLQSDDYVYDIKVITTDNVTDILTQGRYTVVLMLLEENLRVILFWMKT